MQAFTTTQANALTAGQLGGLTTTALGNFSTTQIGALSTTQLQGLTTTQLNALSTDALDAVDLTKAATDADHRPDHDRDRQPGRRQVGALTSTQVSAAQHRADRRADLDRGAGLHHHAGQCADQQRSSAA